MAVKLGLSTNRLEVSHLLLSEQLRCRGGFVLTSKGEGEVLQGVTSRTLQENEKTACLCHVCVSHITDYLLHPLKCTLLCFVNFNPLQSFADMLRKHEASRVNLH